MKRIVVVGDAVLDRDVSGRAERVAPDAPVPVLDVDRVRESPGGAGLTALLCSAPGVEVQFVAPIADDEPGRRLASMLRAQVGLLALPHQGPTRLKTRLRSAGQSLLRLDEGGPGAPDQPDLAGVANVLAGADVVLVSDYGAGTTAHPGLRSLLSDVAASGVPVVWDPHPRGADPVPHARLVTPNLGEADSALARRAGSTIDASVAGGQRRAPESMAAALRALWQAEAVCVTAGAAGAYLVQPDQEPMVLPAPMVDGGDSCGAGDRFAASVALGLARGVVLSEAVMLAVQEASAWVRAGGTAAFGEPAREEVRSSPAGTAGHPSAGGQFGDAAAWIGNVRARGGRLVATGGCFDILHLGHIRSLAEARKLGDALVVLLNSDSSVRRLKGPGRPVVSQDERARMLAALESVDAVVIFDEDTPDAELDRIRPDIWVKGGDYGAMPMPEADLVRTWGGRVLLLPYVEGHSSTSIIERWSQLPAFSSQEHS